MLTEPNKDWIQGHDLGRRFKALVCHDGVFSTLNQWSTEELFFPEHDFGGTLWENREGYERWDPSRHLRNWATPQLVSSAARNIKMVEFRAGQTDT
jgi:dipeptidyl aminopeptidase/acylaminoacyl peptidase